MPHVIEIFASPTYTTTDPIPSNNDPIKPMPAWFRKLLYGHSALYSTLQRAILNLDNWGLFTGITCHHSIDIKLGTLLRQMEWLQMDIENLRLSQDLCEGRLTSANIYAKVHHLDAVVGPRGVLYKSIPWNKKPRNEHSRSF
jgi:hypothetical protein